MFSNTFSSDERLLKALEALPRQLFLAQQESFVSGHSIPPLNVVAQILGEADLQPGHRVLQVGTGTGYFTAVASRLVDSVVTVEKNDALARVAGRHFDELGLINITLRVGEGSDGAPDMGPYDRILVSSPRIRDHSRLLEQLTAGGYLLALERGEGAATLMVRYQLTELGALVRQDIVPVDFSHDSGMTLLDMGVVDRAMLAEARRVARARKVPVIRVLREQIDLEDSTLYRRLATENNLRFAVVDDLLSEVQLHLMELFSRGFLDSKHLLPLWMKDHTLALATDDPDAALDDIRHMYPEERLEKILVTPNDFKRLWTTIELSLRTRERAANAPEAAEHAPRPSELLSSEHLQIGAHLVTLFDALLLDAVSDGASDIHIEPYPGRTRIRLRVDGDLHDLAHYDLTHRDSLGLINVIKIRGDMDIAEKRLPQSGRSQLRVGDEVWDLRIQVQPALHGEAVVIRLLAQSGNLVGIDRLGMSKNIISHYRRLLANPAGLVLVVGPTGSGKTTTLYAGLSELAAEGRRKVITIEDPVEYSIDNIQQVHTHPEIGFTFDSGMRSFVRQDPDVILVGEIRDHETAREALRASQTGHVVLSTLHCNDAVDAIQRLFDLDVLANSIASELTAVKAQKLARRICSHCREAAEPEAHILEELFPDGVPDNFGCFVGRGCEQCGGRGTRGRVAVVEFMLVDAEIRDAISLKYPTARLRAIALDSGLVTMRDSALNHVIEGTVPLGELPRILPAERMAPEKRGDW
ncbi:Flp pilus assembly complex ATPase component TadA [Parahaliea mediterranea]|uniref:Flp pilus assembly complex ATPase component TadA n=2 Tax=Parahaliea mediterranea TaxID=651086 RepID=A0A939IL60_9GAMM|nr:ATPase, T2SS/T4P/T4SS family [Parahaliea mediterranea]MBN7795632.1 Flp pilus assembly complex ATPase component TadA [Parahaliea mediterranea]